MGIDEYMKQEGKKEGLAEGIEQGIEKGREEERRLFVENLLSSTDFAVEKIASLANVSVEFVNKIKKASKTR